MENLELYLPKYLKDEIAAFVEGEKNNVPLLDCLFCELQASINCAYYDNDITEAEADYLRKKYLGLEV